MAEARTPPAGRYGDGADRYKFSRTSDTIPRRRRFAVTQGDSVTAPRWPREANSRLDKEQGSSRPYVE
jgi:hypothetical protein